MTDVDKRLDELSVLMGQYEDNSKDFSVEYYKAYVEFSQILYKITLEEAYRQSSEDLIPSKNWGNKLT